MIRIFIIEEHPVTIAGLRTFFRPSRDTIIVNKTANSIDKALLIDHDSFDVVLLDLWLPSGEPEDNFKKITAKFPGKPVVIYSGEMSVHWHRKMYKLGAKAFINKNADKSLIEDTLKRVIKGETVYSSGMQEYLSKRVIEGYRNPKFGLTTEQEEIIQYFLEGLSAKDIAGKLKKDLSTIHKQLKNIRDIFEVSSDANLMKAILNLPA
jgi:DNA-binding NarL/FixJ family response regulator